MTLPDRVCPTTNVGFLSSYSSSSPSSAREEEEKNGQARPEPGAKREFMEPRDFVSEEDEERADALSPINDQLKLARIWWLLEVVPQKQRWQKDDDSWARALS